MKYLQTLALLFGLAAISMSIYAQKVEVKKDKILSGGTEIALIEKDGCSAISPSCIYYINSLDGSPLITIVESELLDPRLATQANPSGRVRFLRFSFTGFEDVAELKNPAVLNTRPKDVAPIIIKAGLIKDGQLDKNAVNNFIKAHGNTFSKRQEQLNPSIIIIEK